MKTKSIINKKSQGEIITTVLLILLGIAAFAALSFYVYNFLGENLKSTDCFTTAGQLKINTEDGYTRYYSNNTVSINIERGEKFFNLTGISVSIGNGAESKVYTIKSGLVTQVTMRDGTAQISLPNASESRTYIIDISSGGISGINQIKIMPIIYPDQACAQGTAEASI